MENGRGLGRVGSGRVGWTPLFTQLDPSLTLFSVRRGYIAVHFVFLAERLKQAMLSLDKLSIKAVMHTKIDYCWYFIRFIFRAISRRLDKRNAITCRTHNNFNCYHGNVFQSNNESTKKINLPYLIVFKANNISKKFFVALCFAPTKLLNILIL